MQLGVTIQAQQAQKLTMTYEMQQSIKILEMDNLELHEYIRELAMENPAIELDLLDKGESLEKKKEEWLEKNARELENLEYSRGYTNDDTDLFAFEKLATRGVESTLAEYIIKQIDLEKNIENRNWVKRLAQSLDEDGYLRVEPQEYKQILGENCSQKDIEKAISTLQSFEPHGIGARNLEECLILQLTEEQKIERKIIENHLDCAAKRQYSKIARDLGCEKEQVEQAFKNIQSLNPKPGNGFHQLRHTSYAVPDVIVTNFENHYNVIPCDFIYPTVQVSKNILDLERKTINPETKEYLGEKIEQVKWVEKSIGNRTFTLVSVVESIVDNQQSFFRQGSEKLDVLKMSDIADSLGMHESTVSRAVRGKYLQCHQGIYPLRYFFVQGTDAEQQGEQISSQAINIKIEKIINEEDKSKPYSDQVIANILLEKGCKISRRTVAKYREELGFLNSSYRKE